MYLLGSGMYLHKKQHLCVGIVSFGGEGGVNVCQYGLWNIVYWVLHYHLKGRMVLHECFRRIQDPSGSRVLLKLQVVNKMKAMKSGEL